jgi:tripartite-type tricarboxylate transporter receptor subunit TctC
MATGMLVAAMAAFGFLAGAAAQPGFPAKPVTIIVPFAAGGPTDVVARQLSEALSGDLGQPVVAENITGAGGTIGAGRVAQARPDGYTLLLGNIGLATSPTLYRRLPYDPARAFETIGLVTPVPMVLIGRPDLPFSDLEALVAWARAKGADVNLAHAGIGSASHLCATLLRAVTRVPMTPVVFRGTAPVMTEMMAGRIDLACDQTTNALPFIQDGRVKAFAVTTAERLSILPDVPTTAEGGLPEVQVTIWHGLYAPRGTPAPVVERLSRALRVALQDETVVRRLAELGSTPEPQERATPTAHRAMLDAEIARWRPILQAAGEFAD